jgi:phosphoribosylformylglycinamidine (FGAM) synthase-like enzyme
VAPFPGAETGAGGRIRDTHATGIGSLVGAATAGYCVGNLQVPCSLQQYEKEIPCVMCKLNSWLLVYWRILDGRNVIFQRVSRRSREYFCFKFAQNFTPFVN